jgi:hypothetical protein
MDKPPPSCARWPHGGEGRIEHQIMEEMANGRVLPSSSPPGPIVDLKGSIGFSFEPTSKVWICSSPSLAGWRVSKIGRRTHTVDGASISVSNLTVTFCRFVELMAVLN